MTDKPFPHWKPLVPKSGPPVEDTKNKKTGPSMDYNDSNLAFPKPVSKRKKKR
jgi:hypothetical protein